MSELLKKITNFKFKNYKIESYPAKIIVGLQMMPIKSFFRRRCRFILN